MTPIRAKKPLFAVIVTLLVVTVGVGGFFLVRGVSRPSVGDIIEFGGYEWRVLDVQDGSMLIISENVIERRMYHNSRVNEIMWEYSPLRQWLNEDFYNGFTSLERARILETRIINDDNPWYGTSGGNATNDKIFLLSLYEVVQRFGDSGELGREDGRWGFSDRYSPNRIAYDMDGNASWWWLRSPGGNNFYAAAVDLSGLIYVAGIRVFPIYGGVRPALWLNW